jgi:hypothetical protein
MEHGSLLHRKPTSTLIFHDSCSAQDGDKIDTMFYRAGTIIGAAERIWWFV